MQPERVKMIESPENEKRKVLLKLKHIDVKFNVRGRTLNAIRDVSLEIFDKETIAIVGESGSGKSVLTKTFAGMLDANGYISHGNVYFYDEELSKTDVPLNRRNKSLRQHVLRKINVYSHGACCAEEYNAIKTLDNDFLLKQQLSLEDNEAFDKRIKEVNDDINDTQNFLNSLTKKNEEFGETKRKLKALHKQMKDLWKERKEAIKAKKRKALSNKEAVEEYKKQREVLVNLRHAKYDEDLMKELPAEILERNNTIADEIVLSIGRFPLRQRVIYTHQLLKRFKEFIWSGKDVSTDKQKNRIFDPVVFRVKKVDVITVEGNKDKKFIDEVFVPQFKKAEPVFKDARNKTLVTQAKGSFPRLYKSIYTRLKDIVEGKKMDALSDAEVRRIKDFANVAIIYAANYDSIIKRWKFKTLFLNWFKDATESDGKELDVANERFGKPNPIVTLTGNAIIDCARVKFTKDWQKIRGCKIATVFQDPMTSLNPILTIGKQIMIVIQKHQKCSTFEAKRRAIDIMAKVGIPDPDKRFDDYPFQYSGGMRQRIVIAIALSCQPKILICDEPTTALDVTIQAQIIRLIKSLSKDLGFTTVYITHDLGVVANVAERVAVLYGGQIVELGTVEEVFYEPLHPYTWALLSSLPQLAQRGTELFSIPGTPPSLYNKIVGDAFAPRSSYAMAIDFKVEPPMWKVSDTHFVKTWLLDPRAPKVEKPEIIKDLHKKMSAVYKDHI